MAFFFLLKQIDTVGYLNLKKKNNRKNNNKVVLLMNFSKCAIEFQKRIIISCVHCENSASCWETGNPGVFGIRSRWRKPTSNGFAFIPLFHNRPYTHFSPFFARAPLLPFTSCAFLWCNSRSIFLPLSDSFFSRFNYIRSRNAEPKKAACNSINSYRFR